MGKVCCPMEELKLSMTVFQNELPGVLITSTSTAVFLCGKSQFYSVNDLAAVGLSTFTVVVLQ
jgi:hypothetical protein